MKFCLLSDTHRGYSKLQAELLHTMLEEIGEQSPDIILHAGDVGSHKADHATSFWKTLRKIKGLETTPIVYVMGNHDYWSKNKASRGDAERKASSTNIVYNLTRLNGKTHYDIMPDIAIFGFTGWYALDSDATNDRHNIRNYDYTLFRNIADRHIDNAVLSMKESKAKIKILLTHFDFVGDSNPTFMEQPSLLNIFSDADYIISGHSHVQVDGIILKTIPKKVVYYNPGGDYENPKYLMVDIK